MDKDPLLYYKKMLDLHDATFSHIDHEDAMVATVYKVIQPDRQSILKISAQKEHYLRELFFLRYFADKLPVPQVIGSVEPENEIHGAILMECLPGDLLKSTDLTDELAYEIGAQLAKIHLNKVEGYGDPTQLESLAPNPDSYFTFKFEEGVEECKNHLPQSLIEQCHHYYDEHVDLLNSVDGPCMVHRDFRPGNLMVQNGKLQGIIDWAGARFSFAQEDFCPVEHGEWLVSPERKKFFLAGYATIREVLDYKSIMPFLRLNKAIAVIGFTVKQGTWKNVNASIYQFNLQFLENFFKK